MFKGYNKYNLRLCAPKKLNLYNDLCDYIFVYLYVVLPFCLYDIYKIYRNIKMQLKSWVYSLCKLCIQIIAKLSFKESSPVFHSA